MTDKYGQTGLSAHIPRLPTPGQTGLSAHIPRLPTPGQTGLSAKTAIGHTTLHSTAQTVRRQTFPPAAPPPTAIRVEIKYPLCKFSLPHACTRLPRLSAPVDKEHKNCRVGKTIKRSKPTPSCKRLTFALGLEACHCIAIRQHHKCPLAFFPPTACALIQVASRPSQIHIPGAAGVAAQCTPGATALAVQRPE